MALVNNASGVYATLGYSFSDPNNKVQTFSANTQANLNIFPPIINEWQAKDIRNNDVGGYFQNPVSSYVNTIMTVSDTIYQTINTATSSSGIDSGTGLPIPASYGGPSLSAVMSAANNVTVAANNYMFHTNKVSGVTPIDGKDDLEINPYYQTATTFGKHVIYITNQTDGIVDNSPILGSMSSILVGPQLQNYANTVTLDLAKINGIITANNDPTGSIAGILSDLNEMQAYMVARQTSDVTFFGNVKKLVNKFTQLSSFKDAGETEKYLLNNVVGTDKIKSRINS